MSLNCRGLATREKRQDIFAKIKEENFDISLLQDIHWDKRTLENATEEWGYKIICAPLNTQSRGTAILLRNSFEFNIGDTINDPFGNYSLVELHLHNDFLLIIGSIYAPNQDRPDFITTLSENIESFENPNILIAGDWNTTRAFNLDNKNYVTQNNLKMTGAIDDMIKSLSLVDACPISKNTPGPKES